MNNVRAPIGKPRVKVKESKVQLRDKVPLSRASTHPNQRTVMVLREVDPEGGRGAIRTIVEVVLAENAQAAQELAKRYVKKGATVMTDEAPAYGHFMRHYNHQTVNRSKEFSTDEGVNNNQAESFFSRMRRMVAG